MSKRDPYEVLGVDRNDYSALFCYGDDGDTQIAPMTDDDGVSLHLSNGLEFVDSGVNLTVNGWFHVGVTCDGSNVRIVRAVP